MRLAGTHRETADERGYGLIEALMSLALFAIIGVSLYQAFNGLLNAVSVSRSQLIAMELMAETVEIACNLPFDSVGEVGGVPLGVMLPSQTYVRGGQTFTVATHVANIDDPFDGTIGGTPNDSAPADYKRVEITVTCTTNCKSNVPMT